MPQELLHGSDGCTTADHFGRGVVADRVAGNAGVCDACRTDRFRYPVGCGRHENVPTTLGKLLVRVRRREPPTRAWVTFRYLEQLDVQGALPVQVPLTYRTNRHRPQVNMLATD